MHNSWRNKRIDMIYPLCRRLACQHLGKRGFRGGLSAQETGPTNFDTITSQEHWITTVVALKLTQDVYMGKLSERAWGILEDDEGAIETHEVRTDQLQHMITAREGLKLLKSFG